MRLIVLVHALNLALSSALSVFETLPPCAVKCVTHYLPESSCTATDVNCLCNDNRLLKAAEACTQANCTIREALGAKNMTSTACHAPVHDDSRTIVILAPIMGAVAWAFVVIRLTARWKILGWDDGCICFAWLTGSTVSVLNALMSRYGIGKDIWTVPHDDITQMLFYFYISEPCYVASTILTKVGICLFLLRIFPYRSFRITIWATVGTCVGTGFAFVMALIFQCSPTEYSWLFWDDEAQGSCIDLNAGTWAHACINIALDLVILIIPLVQLYTLQTSYSTRKKVQITVMFSVGIIVTIVSALRLQSLVVFMKSHNITRDNLGTAAWSVSEIHVGIICACLPSARVFFGRIVPKYLGVTTNESKYGLPPSIEPRARSRSIHRITSRNRTSPVEDINDDPGQIHIKDSHDFFRLDEVRRERHTPIPLAPIRNEPWELCDSSPREAPWTGKECSSPRTPIMNEPWKLYNSISTATPWTENKRPERTDLT